MISVQKIITLRVEFLDSHHGSLSIAGGTIAVVGALISIGRTVKTLVSFRGAPEAKRTLKNEISELQIIFKELGRELHD